MDNSLNNAISQLQNMLSSEDGKKNIENMINSLGVGAPSSDNSDTAPSSPLDGVLGGFDAANIMKMKNIMDTFSRRDDPRSQLLLALKPYLSVARGARVDTAITLLSLGKIPEIMKNMRG